MKKTLLFILVASAYISCRASPALHSISKLSKFASKEEGFKYLSINDEYTKGFSQFDIQSKTQKINGTFKDWLELNNESLLNWTEDEQAKIKTQLSYIDSVININQYHFNLPKEVVFIKSTMIHEGGAEGYTRGNCIVLKEGIAELPNPQLRELLLHELFHVISRHDAALRKDLYQLIGFTICNSIELTPDLKKMLISNPDAPFRDSYIKLKIGDIFKDCMMILYSDKDYSGGSFFAYLKIGLVELSLNEKKEIVLRNGKPIIYEIDKVGNFFEQIGFNTNYVIDPEEVMADNFMYAILNNNDKPSQKLLSDIRLRLQKKH